MEAKSVDLPKNWKMGILGRTDASFTNPAQIGRSYEALDRWRRHFNDFIGYVYFLGGGPMSPAVKLLLQGIKCDAAACDYRDGDADLSMPEKWLTEMCPKCGARLLTDADYAAIQKIIAVVALTNAKFPPRPESESSGTGSISEWTAAGTFNYQTICRKRRPMTPTDTLNSLRSLEKSASDAEMDVRCERNRRRAELMAEAEKRIAEQVDAEFEPRLSLLRLAANEARLAVRTCGVKEFLTVEIDVTGLFRYNEGQWIVDGISLGKASDKSQTTQYFPSPEFTVAVRESR